MTAHGYSDSGGVSTGFTESPVLFESDAVGISLAGTLTTPSESRDGPAVVLVTGTGQIDRDGTFLGHKLFQVMAHALARSGIASLRYDKRGVGESGGDFSTAGSGDFVADVLGAARYLADAEGFRPERTGLVGHSEGGMVALTAAATAREMPYCVLMASPLLSGRENTVQSFALFAQRSIERGDLFKKYAADLATLVKYARSGGTSEEGSRALEIANELAPRIFNDSTAVVLGTNSMPGSGFIGLLSAPSLETVLGWEPERIVPRVSCPVLVIYASHDTQVPSRPNLDAARELLSRFEKTDWEIREMIGMNHAFQRCFTGMPDEYADGGDVMEGEVLREVASWINGRV